MKWQRFSQRGKRPISYRVIAIMHHAHTRSGCGAKFPASFARCLKNTHTKFEACSFQDMRDLSQNFRFSAKRSLFSDPVTYRLRYLAIEDERRLLVYRTLEYSCVLIVCINKHAFFPVFFSSFLRFSCLSIAEYKNNCQQETLTYQVDFSAIEDER